MGKNGIRAHGFILEHPQEPQSLLDLALLGLLQSLSLFSVLLNLFVLGHIPIVYFQELNYLLGFEVSLESCMEATLIQVGDYEVGETVLLLCKQGEQVQENVGFEGVPRFQVRVYPEVGFHNDIAMDIN